MPETVLLEPIPANTHIRTMITAAPIAAGNIIFVFNGLYFYQSAKQIYYVSLRVLSRAFGIEMTNVVIYANI